MISQLHRYRPVDRQRRRRGLTLVELLVVLAVTTVLAAIILPSVKTILADRKTSQAAIVIKNFIEAARTRAIGKNRSVAVVLERISSRPADLNGDGVVNAADFSGGALQSATASSFAIASSTTVAPDLNFTPYNACIQLSLAEEPLPVTDALIPVKCFLQVVMPPNGSIPPVLVDSDQGPLSQEARIFKVTPKDGASDVVTALGDYFVKGNEISFGDLPARFTILDVVPVNPTELWFSIVNERGLSEIGELALRPYIENPLGAGVGMGDKFTIHQKPRPIYAETIQLPKGTCIDLSLSGFETDKVGFTDYRMRFASDWVLTGAAGVPTPNQLRPVYIVFASDGSLSRVYANEPGGPNLTPIDAVDDIFLHVGRVDQVVMPVDPAIRGRDLASFEAARASGLRQNLTDLSSYVLRLSPRSGSISAAPIRDYGASPGNLGNCVQLSRQGTYGSSMTAQ